MFDTVTNSWDTAIISQFDYTNDKAGRRTDREDSGIAFASTESYKMFGLALEMLDNSLRR